MLIQRGTLLLPALFAIAGFTTALLSVPTDVQQPGTQPQEVGALETPDKCDNCHGGYAQNVEPAFNWRGSMMANATRDPIFWATVAVAEQDFPSVGDFCIRCHTMDGWMAGRSEPTDGSGLAASDGEGVTCDTCHKMANPDDSEHVGTMNEPFVANDGGEPPTGYYGSGMLSLWGGSDKLGPYAQTVARHNFLQSKFHRSADMCGSCHDVSNPVVGDLAPNNGRQPTSDPVVASGVLGAAVTSKAAFNNFPYMYGIVERTFSEHMSSALSRTKVSDYGSLPTEVKAGAIRDAYQAAQAAGQGGNYADGTTRYFSCQSCHVPPTTGKGCKLNDVPVRTDLPLHDMTGANVWAPDAILDQNAQGTLRLGGGLTATQISAIQAGKTRALAQLQKAASLSIVGNTLKVVNLSGHKLPTGYPEGRRMWVNVKWYGSLGQLLREDGRYGPLAVVVNGEQMSVDTILDAGSTRTRVYEADFGISQDWAARLVTFGLPQDLPLKYDRTTGDVMLTLGALAQSAPGTTAQTFHFALNNVQQKDNRIPPYGMTYDEGRKRNVLPVPPSSYGDPGAGGTYRYFDTFAMVPPMGAVRGDVRLMYQSTSWEYIQFLLLANKRLNLFLGSEGENLFDTWLATGMAQPVVMASATWRPSKPTPGQGGSGIHVGPGG